MRRSRWNVGRKKSGSARFWPNAEILVRPRGHWVIIRDFTTANRVYSVFTKFTDLSWSIQWVPNWFTVACSLATLYCIHSNVCKGLYSRGCTTQSMLRYFNGFKGIECNVVRLHATLSLKWKRKSALFFNKFLFNFPYWKKIEGNSSGCCNCYVLLNINQWWFYVHRNSKNY